MRADVLVLAEFAGNNDRFTQNFGQAQSRDSDLQVAELQICAAILNRFTALGTPQTVCMG